MGFIPLKWWVYEPTLQVRSGSCLSGDGLTYTQRGIPDVSMEICPRSGDHHLSCSWSRIDVGSGVSEQICEGLM